MPDKKNKINLPSDTQSKEDGLGKAAQDAKDRDLVHKQFGQWADEDTGEIVAYTRGDKLIDVGSAEDTPEARNDAEKELGGSSNLPPLPQGKRNTPATGDSNLKYKFDYGYKRLTSDGMMSYIDSSVELSEQGRFTPYVVMNEASRHFGRSKNPAPLNPTWQVAKASGMAEDEYVQIKSTLSDVEGVLYDPTTDTAFISHRNISSTMRFSDIIEDQKSKGVTSEDVHADVVRKEIRAVNYAHRAAINSTDGLKREVASPQYGYGNTFGKAIFEGYSEYLARMMTRTSLYSINDEFTEDHDRALSDFEPFFAATRQRELFRVASGMDESEGAFGTHSLPTYADKFKHAGSLANKMHTSILDSSSDHFRGRVDALNEAGAFSQAFYLERFAREYSKNNNLQKALDLTQLSGQSGPEVDDFYEFMIGRTDSPPDADNMSNYFTRVRNNASGSKLDDLKREARTIQNPEYKTKAPQGRPENPMSGSSPKRQGRPETPMPSDGSPTPKRKRGRPRRTRDV